MREKLHIQGPDEKEGCGSLGQGSGVCRGPGEAWAGLASKAEFKKTQQEDKGPTMWHVVLGVRGTTIKPSLYNSLNFQAACTTKLS